jgi:hypothetical protein
MTHESKLEAVRKAVILEKVKYLCSEYGLSNKMALASANEMNLGIADVLIAVKELGIAMSVNQKGRMQLEEMVEYHAQKNLEPSSTFLVHWVGCDWNIHKDSLDLQDPPTIQFLYDVLCEH